MTDNRTTALRLATFAALFLGSIVLAAWPELARCGPNDLGRIHGPGRPPGIDATGAYPDALPVYHNPEDLNCADCHSVHASQSHPYDPSGAGPGEVVPYSDPPNAKLLKGPDPLDLCLSCHDNQTYAPDVVGVDANGLVQRSAGHFDDPEVENHRGHDLGRNLALGGSQLCSRCHFTSDPPRVTCIDCHNPHGNHVARNLQWASDPLATPDLGLFVNPTASGMARYEADNVSYGTLGAVALREVTNMCIDCHHVFTGGGYTDSNGDGIHELHPSYDSERGQPITIVGTGDGGSNPAHWDAGVGSGFQIPRSRFVKTGASDYASALDVDAATNGAICLSCHRAHGSNYAFGLAWPGGYNALGCDQCHLIADITTPKVAAQ